MSGRVGAAIVNYNAGDDLTNCVASLRDQGVEDICVSDNGSTDDSLDILKQKFPDVPVNHLPNPGYGGGMNDAAKYLSNEVLFIINPDAAVRPGAIKALLARLDSDPKIAIVGPRTENEDGSLYPSARRFPSFFIGVGHAVLGMFAPNNRWSRSYKMLDWGHSSMSEVDWVSGAAMFTRRSAFDEVGGFDDNFWMYLEDTDLCFRLRKAGYKVVFDPEAVIVHVGGTATTKSARPFRFIKAHHDSVLRYYRKNARGLEAALYPVIWLGINARLGVAWAKSKAGK